MSALAILCLFSFGLLLIVVEVLIIPGVGVAGIGGTALLLVGAYRAFVDLGPMWGAGAAVGSLVAVVALVTLLPRTRAGKRLVLDGASTGHPERVGERALLGAEGVTLTPLHPTGVARFGSEERDVSAAAGHIDAGRPIRVVALDGMRVLVEPIAEQVATQDDTGSQGGSQT